MKFIVYYRTDPEPNFVVTTAEQERNTILALHGEELDAEGSDWKRKVLKGCGVELSTGDDCEHLYGVDPK